MKAEFAKVNAGVLPWQERSARFLDLALSLRIGRGRPCGNPHLYSVQTRIAENRRIGVPLNSSCLACERRRAVDEAKVVLLIQGGKEPVEVKHTRRWRVDHGGRSNGLFLWIHQDQPQCFISGDVVPEVAPSRQP